jgi:hypothetical protein
VCEWVSLLTAGRIVIERPGPRDGSRSYHTPNAGSLRPALAPIRVAKSTSVIPGGRASVRAECQCRLGRSLALPGSPSQFSESSKVI